MNEDEKMDVKESAEYRMMSESCRLEEQAVIELISLTGFSIHAFDLKGLIGARYAIDTIRQKGFSISRTEVSDRSMVTYILQRYGKIIAHRDVLLTLKISDKVAEGGAEEK